MSRFRRASSIRRAAWIYAALAVALLAPLVLAAFSPQLEWRRAPYIVAGFAGIAALSLAVLQPLLARHALPTQTRLQSRKLHRYVGLSLILLVLIHVGGLWITSAPDVIDALLLRSPTPFSIWGVVAMWALFGAGVLAGARKLLRLRWQTWRRLHAAFATVFIGGTVLHALLIEGTMEPISKIAICALAVAVTVALVWRPGQQRR